MNQPISCTLPGGANPLSRRDFLRQASLGMAVAALGDRVSAQNPAASSTMPMIRLGRFQVSRLILGSNPILGYSHVSPLMDRLMTDYYTLENIQNLLHQCLQEGINTWQTSAHEKIDQSLEKLRNSGRELQWIFLASHPYLNDPPALKEIIRRNRPIAIVHHGGVSDTLWRQGAIEKAHDFAKRVQDLGVMAGLSAHNPAVIRHAEEKGWNLDLYMTCFYRVTRTPEEIQAELKEAPLGELFLASDPPRMCEVIRQVNRPCLGFKILAAGRKCNRPEEVAGAFQFAFQNIKSTDAVIVGMFPRFRNEPAENAALVRRLASLQT